MTEMNLLNFPLSDTTSAFWTYINEKNRTKSNSLNRLFEFVEQSSKELRYRTEKTSFIVLFSIEKENVLDQTKSSWWYGWPSPHPRSTLYLDDEFILNLIWIRTKKPKGFLFFFYFSSLVGWQIDDRWFKSGRVSKGINDKRIGTFFWGKLGMLGITGGTALGRTFSAYDERNVSMFSFELGFVRWYSVNKFDESLSSTNEIHGNRSSR